MSWVIRVCLSSVDAVLNICHRIKTLFYTRKNQDSLRSNIRENVIWRRMAYLSSTVLCLLILMFVSPVYIKLDSTEATTKDSTPPTLNFANVKPTATASIESFTMDGTATKSSDEDRASFNVGTNNATGYTLNIKLDNEEEGNDTLVNTKNSNATISSIIEGGVDYATFSSSSAYNNTWGIIPSSYYSSSVNNENSTNKLFPASTSGITLAVTEEPNANAGNTLDTYYLGLGLKVDYETQTGTYTNSTVIAEYVANPVSYAVYYYDNTDDDVTGMPETNPQAGLVSQNDNLTITLANAPMRDGYAFAGWCLGDSSSISNITIAEGGDICNSTSYTAGQSFGIDATTAMPDTYYLHAMWNPAVTIIYDGNGAYFNEEKTQSTNKVNYGIICAEQYGYVGTNYEEVMTSNISTGGVQNGAYTAEGMSIVPVTISGADKLKVVVSYGLTRGTGGAAIIEGEWNDASIPNVPYYPIMDNSNDISGTSTFVINSDTATIFKQIMGDPNQNYDYGLYIRIYPIYDEETSGATYGSIGEICDWQKVQGEYQLPYLGEYGRFEYWTPQKASVELTNEEAVKNILRAELGMQPQSLTITVYAHFFAPVTFVFDGDGHYFDENETLETNTVTYANNCLEEYAYIGDTPEISKSENVGNDGVANYAFTTNTYAFDQVTIQGADKLKVVVNYDISENGIETIGDLGIIGEYVDDYQDWSNEHSGERWCDSWTCIYGNGTNTFYIEGDTVTFNFEIWGTVDENHTYGYFAEVYPVYEEERENTTYASIGEGCGWRAVTGRYQTPILGEDEYFENWSNDYFTFLNEKEIINMISNAPQAFLIENDTITVSANYSLPVTIIFNGNNVYFDNEKTESSNTVKYANSCIVECGWQAIEGEYILPNITDGVFSHWYSETLDSSFATEKAITSALTNGLGVQYSGQTIEVDAIYNAVTVVFNGNGFYFDANKTEPTNTVLYAPMEGECSGGGGVERGIDLNGCWQAVYGEYELPISYNVNFENWVYYNTEYDYEQSIYDEEELKYNLRDVGEALMGRTMILDASYDALVIIYDGDDLYFDEDGTEPTNTVAYVNTCGGGGGSVRGASRGAEECWQIAYGSYKPVYIEEGGPTFVAWHSDYINRINRELWLENNEQILEGIYYDFGENLYGHTITLKAYWGYLINVSMDSNIKKVTFEAPDGDKLIATSLAPVVYLKNDVLYTTTAEFVGGNELTSWSTTESGTLSSTTTNPTTYTITDDATLTITSHESEIYAVTVIFDENINSIGFYQTDLGVQQVTVSGSTIYLYDDTVYTVSSSIKPGYRIEQWSTTKNGILGSIDSPATTYEITGAATLSLASIATQSFTSCNTPVPGITYMQDINANNYFSVLNSMTTGTQYVLYDNRDNKGYCVAKQADGNIWMTQNLDLQIAGQYTAPLTSLNTDINEYGWGMYEDGYNQDNNGVITWTPDTTATTGSISNWTDGSKPYSAEGGELFVYSSGDTSDDTIYRSVASCVSAGHTEEECAHYHIGNYYNWSSAVASNNSSDGSNSRTPAENSICPAGWRLPVTDYTNITPNYNASSYEPGNLFYMSGVTYDNVSNFFTTNGFNKVRSDPLYFVRGGSIYNGSVSSRGKSNTYLTSLSSSGSPDVFGVWRNDGPVSSGAGSLTGGYTVRCVAKAPTYSVSVYTGTSNVSSVVFVDSLNRGQYVGTYGGTVNLVEGATYNVFAITADGYRIDSWSTRNGGTLGNTNNNLATATNTYSVTSRASLNISVSLASDYTVTTYFDSHVNSVSFYNARYGLQQVTTSGGTVSLKRGTFYTISANYDVGYGINGWSTTSSGILGSTSQNYTTYVISGSSVLNLTSKSIQPPTNCSTPIPGITYMQDITDANRATVLSTLEVDVPYYLMDSRDGEIYCVSKLADGNLWMLDNLRLNLMDSTTLSNITENNTNASNTTLGYLKNGGGTSEEQYATAGMASSRWTLSYTTPYMATGGSCGATSITSGECANEPIFGQWTEDSIPKYFDSPRNFGNGTGKIGAYYNYCAASAGSYCYGDSSVGVNDSLTDATEDICPAGWHLPTGGVSGEIDTLCEALSGAGCGYNNKVEATNANSIQNKLSLSLAGEMSSSGITNDQGTEGNYWTTKHYRFFISESAYAHHSSGLIARVSGYSVRCILGSIPRVSSLTIMVDSGVSDVSLKVGSTSGETITGTKSGNTITFLNLLRGTDYYLYPSFETGYVFDSWAKTDNITGSALGSTSIENTYYTVGTGNGSLTLTSTVGCSTITFVTSNASSIVFNGVAYTNNQSTCVPAGTYHIYGNYGTRYAFSSWSATAGTFENQNYQNTAYTVTGDATITLTGQQVTTAIQNLPSSSCTTTAMPVYDNRDDNIYWIQQLPDGKCWTLDNLALDLTDSTIVNALSTDNTHLDSTALTYFKNGGGTSSDRYPITAYSTFGSTDSYSQPLTNVDSKNITLRPTSTVNYTNSIEGAYGQGQGKIGAYYNYCAASVGYYCFGDGTSAGTSSGNNTYDVCPAGWNMPTGDTSGEYNTLYTNASINSDATTYSNILSAPFSGYFYSGSVTSHGSYGFFWSSTRSVDGSMCRLSVNSSNIDSTGSAGRQRGYSVRCVLAS